MALKRLITSGAVLAMLGCSGDSPESPPAVPEFSGAVQTAPGTTPVDMSGSPGQVPASTNPDPSSSGAGVDSDPVSGPNEGQNPDIVGIGGSEEPPASSGGETSGETSSGEQPPPPPVQEEPGSVIAVDDRVHTGAATTPMCRKPRGVNASL